MKASLLRGLFVGISCFTGGVAVTLTTLTACESISNTSPLPPNDASDLDAGAPPPEPAEAEAPPPPPDAGPPPQSGRIRVANLLEGAPPMDLCVRTAANAPWEPGWITGTAQGFSPPGGGKPSGLAYGEVSQSAFVPVPGVPSPTAPPPQLGYFFRLVPVGGSCADGPTNINFGTTAAANILRQAGGVTIYVYGRIQNGVDAGDANPRIAVIGDNLAPAGNATHFRVVHAVTDLAAFDVVVDGATVLSSIRYGTPFAGPPYAVPSATAPQPSGFATIPAGIPAGATLTLRSGTTVRSFAVPERLRRGIASTVFASGRRESLLVQLCADRTAPDGELADCEKLVSQE